MRQDFGDESAKQTARQHARQDAAEQSEIAGQNFPYAAAAVATPDERDAATSTPIKIIDQPTGLRFLRGRASGSAPSSAGGGWFAAGSDNSNESGVRKDVPA